MKMKICMQYLGVLMASLLLFSCSKEDMSMGISDKVITLRAGIDKDVDSRIVLDDSDGSSAKLLWSVGDAFALVNGDEYYTFTRSDNGTSPVAVADFVYSGSESLPEITIPGLKFVYPLTNIISYASQMGTKEGLSEFLGMEASLPEGATDYEGVSLKFKHTTSVVKMNLIHEAFRGQDVTVKLYAQGLLSDENVITTDVLKGDETDGKVTAFVVIPVTGNELTHCSIHVTVGDKNYTTSLGNKTIASGKMYEVIKDDLIKNNKALVCSLPTGVDFREILKNIIGASTKIKFVANSNDGVAISEIPNAAYKYNGEWLEIHTPMLEFVFNWDSSGMFNASGFEQLQKVTTIDFNSCINTSKVTDMRSMFQSMNSLSSLDLTCFNTKNVKKMASMFIACRSLSSLDLSNFDTSSVIDMNHMFNACTSLTSLDLSSFNTENVTNMGWMFEDTSSLSSLDLSNFNTGNVTNMTNMFSGCSSLVSLDLSHFNTEEVMNMGSMFRNCSSLVSLDLSSFVTENLTSMFWMFGNCSSLVSLDLSSFNTEDVTNMYSIFKGCTSLVSLDLSSFNTENITDMSSMFANCSSLSSLDLSSFNTENITNMGGMFTNCSSLSSLDLSGFSTKNVTSMSNMFSGCSSLASLDLSNFNTENVTSMTWMFNNCSNLTSLDLSSFNTENVTKMDYMFYYCSSLSTLDLSNFNTSQVTDMGCMFRNCTSLISLDIRSFDVGNVTDFLNMFDNLGIGTTNQTSIYVTSELQKILDKQSTYRPYGTVYVVVD